MTPAPDATRNLHRLENDAGAPAVDTGSEIEMMSNEHKESDRPTPPRRIKIGSQRDETTKGLPPVAGERQNSEPTSPSSSEIDVASNVPPSTELDAAMETDIASAGDNPTELAADQPSAPKPTDYFSSDSLGANMPADLGTDGGQAQASAAIPRADEIDDEFAALGIDTDAMSELLLGNASQHSVEVVIDARLPATVVKVHRDQVFFALPGQQEGVGSLRQFDEPPELGAHMEVVVTGVSQDDGLYEVLIPGATVSVADWSDLAEGVVVEAKITGHNQGGLECEVNHLRGFIPASQVSLYRVEDFSEYVDQRLPCVVTEANPARRNLVLSHRAVLEREKAAAKTKLLASLEVGQSHDATITKLMNFGAFADLGGVEGLIHISQLSWDRIRHPSEVVEEGQRVRIRIEKIDPDTGKIGLSLRDSTEHPWEKSAALFPVGAIIEGTVSKIMDFGAFVRVAPGVEGLVHISELASHRVRRVDQVVQEGQTVSVKVLNVDQDGQRMSLSIKGAEADSSSPAEESDDGGSADEPDRSAPLAVKPSGPLKGGLESRSDGDKFGLKW